jgi:Leucine-rich repeat (LRR) protein
MARTPEEGLAETHRRIAEAVRRGDLDLDLSGLGLASLPPEIGQLASLQSLHLADNRLASLPPEIGKIANLQSLDLSNNQLASLPPEIVQLAHLWWLDLSNNQLATLPREIGRLANLQWLYLASNQLDSLPPEIGRINRLQWLYLENNQLDNLPPEIGRINELQLSGNPLSALPREVVSQGITAIKAYLLGQIGQRKRPSRAKLILVGGAEFGKTSLLRALQGETVTKGELSQTHGIELRQLALPHPAESARIILNSEVRS